MDIDIAALRMVERERGISLETLMLTIEDALLKAYYRKAGTANRARVEIDRASGKVTVYATETDEDGNAIGEFDDTPSGFGRIATTTARSVIVQRLREEEDAQVLGSFKDREGTLITGRVQQARDRRIVLVDVGDFEAILPESEHVPGERYNHGDWIRAYVTKVARTEKGPRIELSRRHPGLVRGLFEREVPEIADGLVVVESVAREAGYRTKVAVRATRQNINAKGACIGPMGSRVRAVMNELNGEKIDIVDYSSDPARYVANALSPARVSSVTVREGGEFIHATAIVPDFQLSLAIGKEGQNARLAARLTGCKIDIHSDTEAAGHVMVSDVSRPDAEETVLAAGQEPEQVDVEPEADSERRPDGEN